MTPADQTGALLLRPERLIDGTGGPAMTEVAVAIVGATIADVGPASEVRARRAGPIEEVDLHGCTLLPGLVDSHVHLTNSSSAFPFHDYQRDSDAMLALRGAVNARRALAAGVTTLRDLGGRGTTTLDLRRAVAEGIITGPRILASGRPVTIPGGHGHFWGGVASGVDGVGALVGELIEQGVDAVKVMATGGNMTVGTDPLQPAFSPDELEVIVQTAHAAGRRVAAHARGVAGIRAVVDAGVDTVEHCRMEVGPGIWEFDEPLARQMARDGIMAAPTLAASYRAFQRKEAGGQVGLRDGAIPIPIRQQNARRLREAGVTVVVGTDAGAALCRFDEAAHVEIELLAEAGWTPEEAISAGTLLSASAVGLELEIGSIAPSKRADLVIVAGDPSARVSDIRRVVRVYRDGQLVVRDGQVPADARPVLSAEEALAARRRGLES